jgi:hypothetical protein
MADAVDAVLKPVGVPLSKPVLVRVREVVE